MHPFNLPSHNLPENAGFSPNINHIIDTHQNSCADKIIACQDPFLLSHHRQRSPEHCTQIAAHQNYHRSLKFLYSFTTIKAHQNHPSKLFGIFEFTTISARQNCCASRLTGVEQLSKGLSPHDRANRALVFCLVA